MPNSLIDSILKYAGEGYSTFPTNKKIPLHGGENWQLAALDIFPDDKNYPKGEFGVVLKQDDLIIDIDPRNFPDGRKVWTEFCNDFEIPDYVRKSMVVETGSKGLHVYLKKPSIFLTRKTLKDYPGIDFLTAGSYCLGAGSAIGDKKYTLLSNSFERMEAPHQLLNAIKKQAQEFQLEGVQGFRDDEDNKAKFIEYLATAPIAIEGQGGDTETYRVACRGRDQNLSGDCALDLIWKHWNDRCLPPWDWPGLSNKVHNAYAYAKKPAGTADPVAALPTLEEATPEEDKQWMVALDVTKGDAYRPTLNNAVLFIENEKNLKNKFIFNEFSAKIEIKDKLPWEDHRVNEERLVNDLEVSHVALYLAQTFSIEFKTSKIWEALAIVANKTTYHPIRDELKSYEWDGVKRLDSWMIDYCGAIDTPYVRAVGRKTLIGACARIFNPGCKFDHVLILEGPQGAGKSTTCEIIGGKWFGDMHFDVLSKDTVEYVHSHWIIEFAEMATAKKADVDKLKNFITRTTDDTRLPYARSRVAFKRQCIFIGTVNPDCIGYLTDDTGNRRFWPVYCKWFKLDELKKVRNQLLAEALDCFRKGEHIYLTREIEGMAEHVTKERIVKDPWHDVIHQWLETNKEQSEITTEMIYSLCIGGSKQNMNTGHARRIATALKLYGCTVSRRAWGMMYIRPVIHYSQENPFEIPGAFTGDQIPTL